jgi:hypothetical protein
MAVKVSSGVDVGKVIEGISQEGVRVVLYFFSPELERSGLPAAFSKAFPSARRVGASMIGGWSSAGAVEKGIVAMSLSGEEVEEAFVAFREGVKADPEGSARAAAAELRSKLGSRAIDPSEYVGIVLFDGLCLGEKIVRELSLERGLSLPFIGGSAADELKFERTLVACDGRMSGDGLVLLALKMAVPFFYDHFVHYRPTEASSVVTKAEPNKRIVWEMDGKPAAVRYSELLGLKSPSELSHVHFARNPLGVVIGDSVYARSPNAIIEGTGLQFYCFIEAGTKVSLLKQGDIIENARSAIERAGSFLPAGIRGALLFNCVLRYLEMKEDREVEAFNGVFARMPFAGFNTYGEELFTHHNQTLTALFIGEREER